MKYFNYIFQNLTQRTLNFALLGALGAMLFALMVEPFIGLLPKAKAEKVNADIVFALDATGSMSDAISGVKNGIKNFALKFNDDKVSLKVGLIVFRDRFEKSDAVIPLRFTKGSFTDDYDDFARQVDTVKADGGGDSPESSLDALDAAAQLPFRPNAQKVIILITDAAPKMPDYSGKNVLDIANILKTKGVAQLHLAIKEENGKEAYQTLQQSTRLGGAVFALNDIKNGKGFEAVMPKIGETIANSISTIQGSGYSEKASAAVFATFTAWTGFICLGIVLFLIYAQNKYLKKKIILTDLIKSSVTGLVIGLIAGVLPQLLFNLFPESLSFFSRILGWGLIGLMIGWAVSKSIPNYAVQRAALGGVSGGIVGGIAFVIFNILLSEFFARMISAAMIGFFIGFMISLLEEVLRDAWLLVEWNASDKITIGLGEKPIVLGSSDEAHIYLSADKYPAITAIIRVENQKILFEDKMNGVTRELQAGRHFKVAGIDLSVHLNPKKIA